MITQTNKSETAFSLALLGGYLAAGLLLLPLYSSQIDADGISYISIARKYAAGDFHNAVNGYWSPLLPWLLAPFIKLNVDPLLAAKIIGLAAGLAVLLGALKLSLKFQMDSTVRKVLLISLVPVVYSFFTGVISPDILVAAFLVFYLSAVFDEEACLKISSAVLCGTLGACAYYAKSYALPFFAAHCTAMALFRYLHAARETRKLIGKAYLSAMLVFVLLCLPWAAALTAKYGGFTFGTSGHYNHAVVGPGYAGHPINFEGLFAPPNPTAVSVWEDPSFIPLRNWSAAGTPGGITHQLKLIAENAASAADVYQGMSFFAFAVLLAALLCALGGGAGGRTALYALMTLALYTAGYLPIVVRARYFYLNYILLVMLGGHALTLLPAGYEGLKKKVILIALCLSFIYSPLVNIVSNIGSGREIKRFAGAIRAAGVGGKIASDSRWMESLYIAYYLDARYYGQFPRGASERDILGALKERGIDYFFAWDGRSPQGGWEEVSPGKFGGLRVFSRAGLRGKA